MNVMQEREQHIASEIDQAEQSNQEAKRLMNEARRVEKHTSKRCNKSLMTLTKLQKISKQT